MRLVARLAVGSAVGAAFLVGLFVLFGISGSMSGAELILLAAVVGVSLPIGVLLGFLAARRIWLKGMPARFYRRRPAYFWWPILILFSVFGYRALDLFPLRIVAASTLGGLGLMATIALRMVLFERRADCRLSVARDPAFFERWVEYRVERRHESTAR